MAEQCACGHPWTGMSIGKLRVCGNCIHMENAVEPDREVITLRKPHKRYRVQSEAELYRELRANPCCCMGKGK